MAAVSVNFTILDSKGKSSVTKVRVPTGFSLTQYALFAQAFAQLIANLSEGSITEISVGMPIDLSGATIRSAALATADVFKKALFTVTSTISGLFGKFFFPTYNEVNTVAGSDQLQPIDTDVMLMTAAIENGINVSGEVVRPLDLRGNNLAEVTQAREIFRRKN